MTVTVSVPVRRILAMAAIPALVGGLGLAGGATAAAHPGRSDGIIVEQRLSSGHELKVYVPDDSATGHRARSTPILVVLADGALTADGAQDLAESSGLARIARAEEGVVAFVNPLGDSWTAGDKEVIAATLERFDGYTGEPYDDAGQRCVTDAAGEQVCKFPGMDARVYLFGDRSGADFVTRHVVPGLPIQADRGGPWTPTAVFLSNPGRSVVVPDGDIEVPAYVVNGSRGLNEAFERRNARFGLFGTATTRNDAPFARATLLRGYDQVIEHAMRRWWTLPAQVFTIPDPKETGFRMSADSLDVNGEPLEYYTYTPRRASRSMPLVLVFHGGSDHAEFMVWSTGWARTAAENGFTVVSVDQHVPRTPAEVVTLLDHLVAENPRIDRSRIYASGFSMGSIKSFGLSEQFAERFAAIAPMSGSFAPGQSTGELVPTMYFAGMDSTLPERPNQDGAPNNIDARVADVLARNGVTQDYVFDGTADPVWGIAADERIDVVDDVFPGVSVTAKAYASDDGETYTVLAEANGVGHETVSIESELAWAFLSQYSRGDDGEVVIDGGAFDLSKLDVDG